VAQVIIGKEQPTELLLASLLVEGRALEDARHRKDDAG
jgi:hypothetical protein